MQEALEQAKKDLEEAMEISRSAQIDAFAKYKQYIAASKKVDEIEETIAKAMNEDITI